MIKFDQTVANRIRAKPGKVTGAGGGMVKGDVR